MSDEDHPLAFATFLASGGLLFGGPVIGAGGGCAYFATKQGYLWFRTLSRPAQVRTALLASAALGTIGANAAGRRKYMWLGFNN
jgi:hypothetical protein